MCQAFGSECSKLFAVTSLPKDVGLCAKCQTPNSKHATKCRECGEILPWAQSKVAAQSTSQSKADYAALAAQNAKVKVTKTPGGGGILGAVDWGGTLGFGVLFFGVFLVSCTCPIVGFGLYRYFANEESPLRFAAGAALVLVFFSILLRFFLVGAAGVKATEK